MSLHKRYWKISLAAQMVLVPVLMTAGLFITPFILLLTTFLDLGSDAEKVVILAVAFFCSLIVGLVVGYLFARFVERGPDSAKMRLLPALAPILYALFFGILAVFFSNGREDSAWWMLYTLKNPALWVFCLLLFFTGLSFLAVVAELMGYVGYLLGLVLYEKLAKPATIEPLSGSFKAGVFSLVIIVFAFSGFTVKTMTSYGLTEFLYGESSIGQELTEYDLVSKAPFKENNGLAKLEEPASLQFTALKDMPRLDGATAAYPVYASFVETVYKGLGEYYEGEKGSSAKDVYSAFVASDEYPFDLVKCSKTETAYEELIAGRTDIIFVAEPSQIHKEKIKAQGDDFVLTPIGSEAFVFFTNVKNPVQSLSIRQIQDIYSGKITNWKEAGGPSRQIQAYQRPENSGSQTIMQNKVMRDIAMVEPERETYAGGMGEVISQVASYRNAKNAMGYTFMYYSSEMIKNNQIKYLAVDGVAPTPETVRNQIYPFTVPLYAVTLKSNRKENTERFLKWILSEEGQLLVQKTGYVPIN